MKKYAPSIAENNRLKDDFLAEANTLVWKVEKGKVNPHLNVQELSLTLAPFKEGLERLDNSLGTGSEDVLAIATKAKASIKILSKSLEGELLSKVEAALDEACFLIDLWSEILSGDVSGEYAEEPMEKRKASWAKVRLEKRLIEVKTLIEDYSANERRIEIEILGLEKNLKELDSLILTESNERRINDLYRQIQVIKSKLDTLNVRHSNYDACRSLLDLIYVNAREIVAAGTNSSIDLAKAKVLLDVGKLREVMSQPEKAISVLRRMEAEIRDIAERTSTITQKVFEVNEHSYEVSSEAMAYREALMKKKRESESLSQIQAEEPKPGERKNKTEGEN